MRAACPFSYWWLGAAFPLKVSELIPQSWGISPKGHQSRGLAGSGPVVLAGGGAVTCDTSSLSPQQSAHRAGLRSFIRYGWRWSWRVTAFTTIFNVVSTGLSVYRDKTTISNFAAAGAFTGSLFRMHLGLQGLAGGIVFGTAFGIPAGGLLMAMYGLAGETLQEKRSRERRELYEQRLAEWQSRLSVTEVLGQTENNAQGRPEMERELKSY
ncbi:PREDICTED: complex I assembly factor TIMMDC1, mitochondrial [Corvus brachyrhynchos]|uniref:complex I assembly factor TIMMDC1, mitochondrial n=1 Tax=Corvus brachyrhynchos TaxID=85066 RepID=UPI0005344A07|nr:PREDICTED: complex I assembly factor TIMMDC1, mitochondrial [Corvus brachyrhynchos]